jgi:hypothetical protein
MADSKPDTAKPPSNYEVLEPIMGPGRDESLQATFTANNGIRLTIWNDDMEGLASFDLTADQAKFIGAKLVKWGIAGHG